MRTPFSCSPSAWMTTTPPRFPLLALVPCPAHPLTLHTYSLEKNSTALQKEAKAYLDAVRNVSAASTRIATTIDLFFGSDSGEQAISANAYKRAVEELEGNIARSIVRFFLLLFLVLPSSP